MEGAGSGGGRGSSPGLIIALSVHIHGWLSSFMLVHFHSWAVTFIHGGWHSFVGICVCSWVVMVILEWLHSFLSIHGCSWGMGGVVDGGGGEVLAVPPIFLQKSGHSGGIQWNGISGVFHSGGFQNLHRNFPQNGPE